MRLNKTRIEALPVPAAGYAIEWDDEIQGFGLRITSTGSRAFVLQSRIAGRSRRMTLGKYPGLTPDVARKRAQSLIGTIASGGDPVASKARKKLESKTLGDLFHEYVNDHRRKKDGRALKQRTRDDMGRALEEAFSDWKTRPVTSITTDMVRRRYADRVARSVVRANIQFRYLRAVLNYAAAAHRDADGQPLLAHNPVSDLSRAGLWHGTERRRTVMTPDDLRKWVPAVEALVCAPERDAGTGRQSPKLRHGQVSRDLLMFIALTGCRRSEALGLCRRDVDLSAGTLVFRDTKNRQDHELPLAAELARILERRLAAANSEFVFSSPFDERPMSNLRAALGRVREATGLAFTLHDLRRLAATTLERQAVPAYTIKACLNHLPGANDVTGGYVVVDRDMKLRALRTLEAFILRPESKGAILRRTSS